MAEVDVRWLWNRRLAHVNMRSLQSLLKGDHVHELTNVSFAKDRACSACIEGKLHETAHCRCQNRRISGRGSRTVRRRRMVTGGGGHNVYPGLGPLDGGNTLLPA